MKPTPRTAAVLALGAVLIAGISACSIETSAKADKIGVVEKLPEDLDQAKSKENAQEFRSWVDAHGSAQEKDAVGRVQRIIGEWNKRTGNAYISTDISAGKTQEKDPQAAASAIAKAFGDWQNSDQGYASVYDVSGNAMITNYKF
ncbi:hypothetical protein AB0O07_33165 [Streptomyces sp. NPDC093085]|uniref:hypothetical protein n=1 Tax=Streptomyces sp. NPDC093085 TaxID=3155068 RepID=UPI00343692CD